MNKTYKKNFLQAGALAKQVRAFGKSLIQKDASYNAIIKQINQKITELGAIPAFPPQMALDHVAAHFLAQPDEDIIFSNQVIKLDIGVCYEGAIGDCAVTVDLSGKYQKLIDAVEAGLLNAEKIVKVGLPIREIGKVIDETISSYGFKSVKNLCGHGLALNKIHTAPSIPNYDDNSKQFIKAGMTFAIEPFATDGKGFIYDAGNPTIFSLITARPVKSKNAKALLEKILTFKGLPFAIHTFIDGEISLIDVKLALNELIEARVIQGYAPLLEEANGIVAQAENSILVDDEGQVFITTR